jgi:lipoprotein signal peptidase
VTDASFSSTGCPAPGHGGRTTNQRNRTRAPHTPRGTKSQNGRSTMTIRATTSPRVLPARAVENHRRRPLTAMTATGAAVTAVDLTIKYLVVTWIPPRQQLGLLAPITNPEFTLGVAGGHPLVMVALMTLGVVAALAVVIPLVTRGRVPAWAAGLTIGGAVANTVDRALNGAVQDYLVVGHVVLNLADAAVVIGMAITAYSLLPTGTRVSRTDTRVEWPR